MSRCPGRGGGRGPGAQRHGWLLRASRRPYLTVGWLWFLGMLVPVIGLVQVGGQGWADRILYLPSIGFFVIVVWSAAEWAARHPAVKLLVPVLGAALVAATLAELRHWKDTRALFGRAMEVTADNYLAMTLVGSVEEEGKLDDAIGLCRQALSCKPFFRKRIFFSAAPWRQKGGGGGASDISTALRLRPDFGAAHVMAGLLLAQEKEFERAIVHYQAALKSNPGSAAAQSDSVVETLSESKRIMERLKKGEDFAELAAEKSVDPTSNQGGYLGKLDPTTLRPELRDALRGVRAGEISPIARIPEGYAILKIDLHVTG